MCDYYADGNYGGVIMYVTFIYGRCVIITCVKNEAFDV